MPGVRYFFDIAVYRLPEADYYAQMEQYIERMMYPPGEPGTPARREFDAREPAHRDAFRDHLWEAYGGCWIFNEIIGYIRLHFLGSQIRGEYFSVKRKRIVRTRRRTIEYRTWKLASEIDIPHRATSVEIFELVLRYLHDCQSELPGRHIDMQQLKTIGPCVDWRKLYEAQ
jgi:hypothetical protein